MARPTESASIVPTTPHQAFGAALDERIAEPTPTAVRVACVRAAGLHVMARSGELLHGTCVYDLLVIVSALLASALAIMNITTRSGISWPAEGRRRCGITLIRVAARLFLEAQTEPEFARLSARAIHPWTALTLSAAVTDCPLSAKAPWFSNDMLLECLTLLVLPRFDGPSCASRVCLHNPSTLSIKSHSRLIEPA